MSKNQRQEDQLDEPAAAGVMEAAGDLEEAANDGPIPNPFQNEQVQFVNAFVRALGNRLVTEKILFFLNFEDMKALSAVSSSCYGAVRNNIEFKKRAGLVICQESVASQVLQETSYKWRQISIDLCIPALEVEQIAHLLPSSKALSFWLSDGRAPDRLPLNRYLTEIISKATDLECLEIETSIFKSDLTDVFSNPIVQNVMTNLKVLVIQTKIPKKTCYIDGVKNEEDFPFKRNFRLLAEMPLKLNKFVFGKVVMGRDQSECCHVKFIPKIVKATKDTLEELELHLNVWKFDEMMEIRCSNLKRLSLSAQGAPQKEVEIVEAFLRNQPPLQELVIGMKVEFPLRIVQTFPEIVNQMKKLHIVLVDIRTDAPVNWTFLETMNQLKDFRIQKPVLGSYSYPTGYKTGEEFVAKLPSGLEKIWIRRFGDFWTKIVMEEVPTNNIGDLLSRYVNLTEIDFLRSGGAITDLGMQSIIINCKKLTSLALSYSLWLTDFGISGVKISEDGTSEEKVGVSLNDLKGLIRLKIRDCPNVSPEWILKVVEFKFLRFFKYDQHIGEPKAFVAQIARQNPCLEEAALRIFDPKYDDLYLREMKQEMKQTNPRVRIKIIPNEIWVRWIPAVIPSRS